MLNTFKETFEVTEMRTSTRAILLLLGAEGGGEQIRGTLGYVSDQNDFPTPADIVK